MNTNPSIRFLLQSRLCLTTCVLGLGLPVAVSAQAPVRDDRVVPPTREVRVVDPALKKSDRDFLEKAAKTSMSEIAISRVAAARTSNADVRRLAQMMVEDHQAAIEQLSAFASTRGVLLPAKDPTPDKWEKRDAKDFDKEYLEKMIADHEDAVKLFDKQAKNGDDPEAVAYARRTLPKLQQHLQHALDLKRALTEKRDRR